jgi:Anti-sigma-K factor rskA
MNKSERLDDHQRFLELAALAQRGNLSTSERLTLERHLQMCASCRCAYEEYAVISTEGMAFLAATHGYSRQVEDWDDSSTRSKLLALLEKTEQRAPTGEKKPLVLPRASHPLEFMRMPWAATIAASILILVAFGAYRLGEHTRPGWQNRWSPTVQLQDPASAKKISDAKMVLQSGELARLQTKVAANQQEILRLRDALRASADRSSSISATNLAQDQQLHQLQEQRDKLLRQLQDTEESYRLIQAQLADLRAERDKVLLRTTSLESKVDELTASTRDQERKLKDDETYLASDRDIRELMGARKLYIADVFDVDSGSRTRKPFGRVFYTQNKSLIFYAFDLDHQPGVKNASAFQVWGQRDAESGEKIHAMNLGILYMDSESNRRWVLRLDDPKQLTELDAVFVTVEPQGGSQKPTGKPFLYALLRREANHP